MCTLELFLSENVWSELSLYCDKVSPSVFSHRAACFVINLHIHSMTQHVDTIIEVAPLSCFCLLGFPSGGVQNGTNSGGHRLLSGPAGRPLLMPRGPPHTLWGRLLTHLYEEVPKPCPVSNQSNPSLLFILSFVNIYIGIGFQYFKVNSDSIEKRAIFVINRRDMLLEGVLASTF